MYDRRSNTRPRWRRCFGGACGLKVVHFCPFVLREGLGIFTVGLYLKVRHAHFEDGLSGRQIARDFGISRDSVSKMLAYSEPPGYRRTAPIVRHKLDLYVSQIDEWLEEDKARPRKQRHTAKRIFERLRPSRRYFVSTAGQWMNAGLMAVTPSSKTMCGPRSADHRRCLSR